jgi:hypothetical protein
MKILAIDPGTVQSGWVIYVPHSMAYPTQGWSPNLEGMGIEDNYTIREWIRYDRITAWNTAVIEKIESYGPKHQIGKETITTIEWIGRFTECVDSRMGLKTMHTLTTREVRLHLCGYMGADKPAIRRALLDRFGPQGTKKNPGVLYGVREHIWSALALAVVFADRAEGIVWKPKKEPSIGS